MHNAFIDCVSLTFTSDSATYSATISGLLSLTCIEFLKVSDLSTYKKATELSYRPYI